MHMYLALCMLDHPGCFDCQVSPLPLLLQIPNIIFRMFSETFTPMCLVLSELDVC